MARMRIVSNAEVAAPEPEGGLTQRSHRERRPLALALLLSLVLHALLLSLTFGGDEFGIPGLVFPWRDRRIEVPDLRIVLVPPPVAPAKPTVRAVAEPPQRTSIEPRLAGRPAPTPRMSPARRIPSRAVANVPAAKATVPADAPPDDTLARAAPAQVPVPTREPDRAAPEQTAERAGIDAEPAEVPSPDLPAVPVSPTALMAAAPSASSPASTTSASRDPGDVASPAQQVQ